MSDWDDLQIGQNEHLTSACIVNKEYYGISQNRKEYWISDQFLDCGMRINKDTPEGKKLKKMIDAKYSYKNIQNYLAGLIVKKMPFAKLKKKIREQMEESYKKGWNDKTDQIKSELFLKLY